MSTLTQFLGASATETIPAEVLIVGGGGGGGGLAASGSSACSGGGSGRLIYATLRLTKGTQYSVTVGGGGSGGSTGGTSGSIGSSSLLGLAEAGGGGGGSTASDTQAPPKPGVGGSFGGSNYTSTGYNPGTPDTQAWFATDNFGYSVAGISASSQSTGQGCTGGGAGEIISSSRTTAAAGLSVSITGAAVTYAAGGAGANAGTNTAGTSAGANTGTGGGGASTSGSPVARAGGNGGSGIVVIAYPDTYAAPTSVTGTYTQPSRSGWRVYSFTGSGSITL